MYGNIKQYVTKHANSRNAPLFTWQHANVHCDLPQVTVTACGNIMYLKAILWFKLAYIVFKRSLFFVQFSTSMNTTTVLSYLLIQEKYHKLKRFDRNYVVVKQPKCWHPTYKPCRETSRGRRFERRAVRSRRPRWRQTSHLPTLTWCSLDLQQPQCYSQLHSYRAD